MTADRPPPVYSQHLQIDQDDNDSLEFGQQHASADDDAAALDSRKSNPLKKSVSFGKNDHVNDNHLLRLASDEEEVTITKRKGSRVMLVDEKQEKGIGVIFTQSDVSGLKEIWDAKASRDWCMAAFWAIIFLIMVIMTIIGLIYTINDFYDNPILTTINIVQEPDGLHFPDITLCHPTYQNETHIAIFSEAQLFKSLDKWDRIFEFTEGSSRGGLGDSSLLAKKTTNFAAANTVVKCGLETLKAKGTCYDRVYNGSADLFTDYFGEFGAQQDVFIEEASWLEAPMERSEATIIPIIDRDRGRCFIVRPPGRQFVAGAGLSLVLNMDNWRMTGHLAPPLFEGVYMYVAHQYDIGQQEKILLHPGMYISVGLETTLYNLMMRPRENGPSQICLQEDEVPEVKYFDYAYSLDLCRVDCIMQSVEMQCDCQMIIDPSFLKEQYRNQSRVCDYTQMSDCARGALQPAPNSTAGMFISNCTSNCKIPCSFWKYRTQMSFMRFPGAGYMDEVRMNGPNEGITEDQVANWTKNYIILDIAFTNMQYQSITQEPSMTFWTFLDNVGGMVGLWIGASIITLLKFITVSVPVFLHGLYKQHKSIKKIRAKRKAAAQAKFAQAATFQHNMQSAAMKAGAIVANLPDDVKQEGDTSSGKNVNVVK